MVSMDKIALRIIGGFLILESENSLIIFEQ
jgi:hypothetical protein